MALLKLFNFETFETLKKKKRETKKINSTGKKCQQCWGIQMLVKS